MHMCVLLVDRQQQHISVLLQAHACYADKAAIAHCLIAIIVVANACMISANDLLVRAVHVCVTAGDDELMDFLRQEIGIMLDGNGEIMAEPDYSTAEQQVRGAGLFVLGSSACLVWTNCPGTLPGGSAWNVLKSNLLLPNSMSRMYGLMFPRVSHHLPVARLPSLEFYCKCSSG